MGLCRPMEDPTGLFFILSHHDSSLNVLVDSPTTYSPSKPATPAELSRPPLSLRPPERCPLTTPLSAEGSIIPGESEEDKTLRHEYVLVGDTRAVEFNQAVDGKDQSMIIQLLS